jgi:hypothetical protein
MKRSLTILLTLLALTFSTLGITSPAAAAQKSAVPPSAAEFLNADGTLNLSAGYSGNLDISDYSVTLDPMRGPLFSPAQTLTLNAFNALGTGLNAGVSAIAISGTDVYVGGVFSNAGGVANANRIAKWDGSAWSALGTGLSADVLAIAISGTDVYAGGSFINAGGDANADHIAKWDGSAWSALGTGLNDVVYAIATSGTNVYAGGLFSNAGGDANADRIAKWDGSAWSALGGTPLTSVVQAIAISGTDVYIGGWFTDAGGDANADYIAKWDGSAWSALGIGVDGTVLTIAISGTDVYAGGYFLHAGGSNINYIAKWNGSAWSALGTTPLNSWVNAITVNGTDVYIGGGFTDAGNDANADYIAKYTNNAWSALGTTPLGDAVNAIAVGGDLYAGGSFLNAGGDTNADYLAVFPIPPTALSINRVSVNPTNLTGIDFTVTFSEPVTDVDAADFILTNTFLTGASVSGVSGSGAVRTVTVNSGTGNGTIRLDLRSTATIQDMAANVFTGPYLGGQIYEVRKGTAPTVPVLVSPLTAALVSNTPALNWNDSSAIMALAVAGWHYEVNIASAGGFNQNYNTVDDADAFIGLGESQITITTPLPDLTTFTWKVRAYNDENQYSAWSLVRTFKTVLVPELNLPVDNESLSNKRPTFEWHEVPGATGYTLQILKAGAVVKTAIIPAPAYTYAPTADLLPLTPYTWKVKANGVVGGVYSAPLNFTTSTNPPLVPVLFAPANLALLTNSGSQVLDWNPVLATAITPVAGSYEIQYANNKNFLGATFVSATVDDPTTQISITTLPGRSYYWRVRSFSSAAGNGNFSAWSLVRELKVKFVAPTQTSPISGDSGVGIRPTFIWNPAGNAIWTSYTLTVATNPAFTAGLRTFTINAPNTHYTIPNSLPALTAGLKYWRVKINGLYFPITSAEVSPVNTFTP